MRYIASGRFSYFSIFLTSLLITFLSPQIATCISVHVPLLLLLLLLLRFYHIYAGYLQLCT